MLTVFIILVIILLFPSLYTNIKEYITFGLSFLFAIFPVIFMLGIIFWRITLNK